MSASQLTERAIVEAAKRLMREKPLEELHVRDIARACGINRNTFYYHFTDKYAIFEWVFAQELEPLLRPLLTEDGWLHSLDVLTDQMRAEPAFYASAMRSQGPNSFPALLTRLYKDFFMRRCGASRLTDLSEQEREMVARFYSHAVIGMLRDWAALGMKQDVRAAQRVIAAAIEANVLARGQ